MWWESKFAVKSGYQGREKQETCGGSVVCASQLHSNSVVGEEKQKENPTWEWLWRKVITRKKGEKEPGMVKVTEYAGKKPIARIRGDQKRKCAKTPSCKKMCVSKKRKFITVWRSGQGQRIKAEETRKETAYEKSAEAMSESDANGQRKWEGRGTKHGAEEEEKWDAEASSSKSCWTEQELERQTLTSICRQHKPQLMLEKHFTVPEEKISSSTWYHFFTFWIQNRCTFK